MRWALLPLLVFGLFAQRTNPPSRISTYLSVESPDPRRITIDAKGNLYLIDASIRVLKVTPAGVLSTVAGNGTLGFSGDGGAATSAEITASDVATDSNGNLYLAGGGHIRKVTPDGTITTIAGNGQSSFSGDGQRATLAAMDPRGVAVDSGGNIFVADADRVRKITPDGIIRTVAGGGFQSNTSEADGGPARAARLSDLSDVALDPAGNIYIAESGSNSLRKVSPRGVINTIAPFNTENAFDVDKNGVVYLTEAGRVRKVSMFSLIPSTDQDRLRSVQLKGPLRFSLVDSRLNTYVFDFSYIAGTGTAGFSGDDGPATAAQLSFALTGLALDADGNVYVLDTGNKRVRKITGPF